MNTPTQKTSHYWRIHRRVCRRLWVDLPLRQREIIAEDALHVTDEFKWFDAKVAADTERLFQDSAYYDNLEHTFRIPTSESLFRQL